MSALNNEHTQQGIVIVGAGIVLMGLKAGFTACREAFQNRAKSTSSKSKDGDK